METDIMNLDHSKTNHCCTPKSKRYPLRKVNSVAISWFVTISPPRARTPLTRDSPSLLILISFQTLWHSMWPWIKYLFWYLTVKGPKRSSIKRAKSKKGRMSWSTGTSWILLTPATNSGLMQMAYSCIKKNCGKGRISSSKKMTKLLETSILSNLLLPFRIRTQTNKSRLCLIESTLGLLGSGTTAILSSW